MKIAFIPMDGHGHVNSCLGLARFMRSFGHSCVFIIPSNWITMVEAYNFETISFKPDDNSGSKDPLELVGKFISAYGDALSLPTKEKFSKINVNGFRLCADSVKATNDHYKRLIKLAQPDLIIYDFWVTVPAIILSNLPYILLFSCNPILAYWKSGAPPYSSGLGKNDENMETLSTDLRKSFTASLADLRLEYDNYLEKQGVDLSTEEKLDFSLLSCSPYLNLYPFPSDLDYQEFGPVPEKWFRVDHMVREPDNSPLGIDEAFFQNSQNVKKILFTLGSMGTSIVSLMTRLIEIFGKSRHQFIVAKGVYHDKIELPGNMVGGKYLNQMKIIPQVDLVILHGGNNTFIETLFYGKPVIILPLFGDQHDNGRRVVDMKIGQCYNPFQVTESELLTGIDQILEDSELHSRIAKISHNLRNSQSHLQLNSKLCEIVQNQRQTVK